uniref:Uncharacterized protein n=1 Tax=viral metagenome TaxID=1070528 RepID=A0A6H1ZR19_9ZZZZ
MATSAKVALAYGFLLQVKTKADEAVAKKGTKKNCYINAEFVKSMLDQALPPIYKAVMED